MAKAAARKSSARQRRNKSGGALTEKGVQTRASLIDAARKVFERDGYVDTRVADIVEAAGVAHGTFYIYFPSKKEIFKAVIQAHQSEIEAIARKSSSPEATTALKAIEASNRAYLEGYAHHRRLMAIWAQVAMLEPEIGELLDDRTDFNIQRTERALHSLKAEGYVASDLDVPYAARALSSMVKEFCVRSFHGDAECDIERAVAVLTSLWARGIGLDPNAPRRPGT